VKRYHYQSGLLVSFLFLLASCSSLTLNAKDRSPATEQSTVGLLWLLATFHTIEKSRRVPGWQLEDPALLKIIKDNPTRLWHHHPGKKLISLEDWREQNCLILSKKIPLIQWFGY